MGRCKPVRGLVKVKQFFQNHKNGIFWLCGGKPRPKVGFSGTAFLEAGDWQYQCLQRFGLNHQLYLSPQRQESRKMFNAVISYLQTEGISLGTLWSDSLRDCGFSPILWCENGLKVPNKSGNCSWGMIAILKPRGKAVL